MSFEERVERFGETYRAIKQEVAKAVVGQDEVVDGVLTTLAAHGHVLLEGLPGLGKTLLVRSLAQVVDLSFGRIQFTPDMMPADVTGTNVLSMRGDDRDFEFRPGPIFVNLLLADEINRATPKTQSALLEAMQERSVTSGGQRHVLQEPFLVMATQNPIEQEGTYPLPEAQVDRFFFKLNVPYPTRDDLAAIVTQTTGSPGEAPQKVVGEEELLRMRALVHEVPIADNVLQYALSLVVATHPEGEGASEIARKYGRYGSSPRGAQALVAAGKVYAMREGRLNVAKDDLRAAAKPALRHRVLLNYEAEADGVTPDTFMEKVVEEVDSADRDPVST
jgi:MoxR-like ATPase